MTRRLKCRIDPEQSPYTCMLPEHKPVRRGREMIDLLAVEEPKPKPRGVPRVNDRRVLNGIFWVLRSGAPWRDLPQEFGPYTTCYNRFVRWRLPLARLEPYGMIILIAALLVLPVLGAQMDVDLNILPHLITGPIETIIRAIVWLTGNG